MTMLAQTERAVRATAEYPEYQFRAVTLAGTPAVYVISPSGSIYTVTTGGHHARCNCPDYLKRCAGTLAKCKHIHMAEKFQGPQPETHAEHEARVLADRALWG